MKEKAIKVHVVDEGGWNPVKEREMRKERLITLLMYAVLASPVVFFVGALYIIFRHHTHQYAMAVYCAVGILVYVVFLVYKIFRR